MECSLNSLAAIFGIMLCISAHYHPGSTDCRKQGLHSSTFKAFSALLSLLLSRLLS